MHMGGVIGQQLRGHLQAAVAAQREFGTVLQAHCHGTGIPRFELLTGKQAVTFHQQPPVAVVPNRVNLANHLADHAD